MADTNTVSTLDGLFKEVYADGVKHLLPDCVKILKEVKFSERTRIGDSYHQPVTLSGEHGVTYALAGAGAFTLDAPVVHTNKDAVVDGSQVVLRSYIDYEAASKAVSGGTKAFVGATSHLVMNMTESLAKRLETSLLYGRSGIGQFSSITDVNATTEKLTIDTATWASGIWSGSEGAIIELFNGTSQVGSDYTISAVDAANRVITVTASSGDITTLKSTIAGSPTPTLDIFFKSAYDGGSNYNEMLGIDKIITTSGSVFGIDNSAYSLWAGNSYAVGSAALTQAKVDAAVALAVGRGLNENACLWVSPVTWGNLNTDQSAKRRYDSSYKSSKGDDGFESIVYYSQNGMIEVKPHSIVKEGEAFLMPMERVQRIGSTDLTFNRPGAEGKFFKELENKAGYEYRSYANQAVFLTHPARFVKFTGIVNT